jgi:hypothetical protein
MKLVNRARLVTVLFLGAVVLSAITAAHGDGVGVSNEWAGTASIEIEHLEWGKVLFDRDAVM